MNYRQYIARMFGKTVSSGVKSADAAIKSAAGEVYWITISEVTGNVSVELKDSLDNSGVAQWGVVHNKDQQWQHAEFNPPIKFSTGIFLDVDTATCKVTVGYR